jgi:DNA-binding transcriptional ArsR family regulator
MGEGDPQHADRGRPNVRQRRHCDGPVVVLQYFDYYRKMEENDVVAALAALAQPVRLRVFRALVVAGADGLTPSSLSEALAVAPTSLSFHLKELTHAGLVTQARDGRNLIYRAAFGEMNALMSYLTENCCQGEDCAVSSAACAC